MNKTILTLVIASGAGYLLYRHFKPRPPVPPNEPYFTWEFPSDGYFERESPVEVSLVDLDPNYIPEEINVVWYGDEWFRPGWAEYTLSHLMSGKTYTVVVSGACVWNIPY